MNSSLHFSSIYHGHIAMLSIISIWSSTHLSPTQESLIELEEF